MTSLFKFKRLHPEAKLTRATGGAAGYDLYATTKVYLPCGDTDRVPTGVALEIPPGWEGQVRPRSGLSSKGLLVQLGTIDSDYRGEVNVIISNQSVDGDYVVEPGDRIAQIVFAKVYHPTLEEVLELSPTERGEGGFGSTGR